MHSLVCSAKAYDRPAGFGDEDVYLQGNIWEQYLLCYYWTVATLTTNGQIGEMGPKCMLEVRTLFPNIPCQPANQWVLGASWVMCTLHSRPDPAWANHLESHSHTACGEAVNFTTWFQAC